ncbi:unnamed protein product [Moneuplotes crassus]|uniref:Thioredoxin domain-containing protein n=1 Tax=Euplotes crassus TaxID=5936 RepID=A0AAD2D3H6_EUPCR|nr:unnamed protein product [Moneuplotes crassus]
MKELDTIEEFNEFINGNPGKIVVIDFHAEWCGPCKIIGPYIECFPNAPKYKDKAVFAKVDVDENDDAAAEYQVSAMPTFMLFYNGKKINFLQGADILRLVALIDYYVKML